MEINTTSQTFPSKAESLQSQTINTRNRGWYKNFRLQDGQFLSPKGYKLRNIQDIMDEKRTSKNYIALRNKNLVVSILSHFFLGLPDQQVLSDSFVILEILSRVLAPLLQQG